MSDISDLAIGFEAVKVGINQNKDGIVLRLAIHPSECPPEVWKDWVGTRYQCALVKIGDDEQPTAHEDTLDANQAIKSAGMLCRNPEFQEWLEGTGLGDRVAVEDRTDWAIATLREHLGVVSRSEMRTNRDALQAFKELRERFIEETSGL